MGMSDNVSTLMRTYRMELPEADLTKALVDRKAAMENTEQGKESFLGMLLGEDGEKLAVEVLNNLTKNIEDTLGVSRNLAIATLIIGIAAAVFLLVSLASSILLYVGIPLALVAAGCYVYKHYKADNDIKSDTIALNTNMQSRVIDVSEGLRHGFDKADKAGGKVARIEDSQSVLHVNESENKDRDSVPKNDQQDSSSIKVRINNWLLNDQQTKFNKWKEENAEKFIKEHLENDKSVLDIDGWDTMSPAEKLAIVESKSMKGLFFSKWKKEVSEEDRNRTWNFNVKTVMKYTSQITDLGIQRELIDILEGKATYVGGMFSKN